MITAATSETPAAERPRVIVAESSSIVSSVPLKVSVQSVHSSHTVRPRIKSSSEIFHSDTITLLCDTIIILCHKIKCHTYRVENFVKQESVSDVTGEVMQL